MGEAGRRGSNRHSGKRGGDSSRRGGSGQSREKGRGRQKEASESDRGGRGDRNDRGERGDRADRGDRSDRGGGFLEGGRFKKSPALDRRQRPVWTETARPPLEAPQLYECPLCQKPIRDILTAISDKVSGLPLHFDCVLARLNETEQLGSRDAICYLGAGRFGVVHYDSSYDSMGFRIKKVLELEDKEVCGKWRRSICERFL